LADAAHTRYCYELVCYVCSFASFFASSISFPSAFGTDHVGGAALSTLPRATAEPMVRAHGLEKRYRNGHRAVCGIDFSVARGECFGLLGPNGAGKSSVMRMISCTARVSAGTLRVFGLDPTRDARSIKTRLGVVAQDDVLDPELTWCCSMNRPLAAVNGVETLLRGIDLAPGWNKPSKVEMGGSSP
jgi:ABC-type glutathione transport system ATPase component